MVSRARPPLARTRAGHAVSVVALDGSADLADALAAASARCTRTENLDGLLDLARARRAHVVVVSADLEEGLFAEMADGISRRLGIPCVVHERGRDLDRQVSRILGAAVRGMAGKALCMLLDDCRLRHTAEIAEDAKILALDGWLLYLEAAIVHAVRAEHPCNASR